MWSRLARSPSLMIEPVNSDLCLYPKIHHLALWLRRTAYLVDWNGRGWALWAGLPCGLGNGLQFMGGQAARYTAADAVQAKIKMFAGVAQTRDISIAKDAWYYESRRL
ncbi:hypothetical protein K1719_017610 [Acacia pycnantha]|nr:hypothetical protein K1719_017610 [Acacia pycnantha]